MAKTSAGLVLYRRTGDGVEVLLVHSGGPFWAGKDAGAWSIPKGEYDTSEDPLAAAKREFEEETGCPVGWTDFTPLEPQKQRSGKVIVAWAVLGDCDAAAIRSNTFSMEWPPRSGRQQRFPEVDRAAWFAPADARTRIVAGQAGFLDQLERMLGIEPSSPPPTPPISFRAP